MTPSFLLQKCKSAFPGETVIFYAAIITSDSAKSESEVGMKKVSLNLRLFGEESGANSGVQGAEHPSTQTMDCAAEQSENEKGHTGSAQRDVKQQSRSAAPVGSESEERPTLESRGEFVQEKLAKGENIVGVPASPTATLPAGAARIIQSLAAMYQKQETDIDGIADALGRTETKNALEERLRRRSAAKQYQILLDEAGTLSKKVRGFNLEKELSDRRFCGMLRAGFSIEEAWQAVHFNQLLHAAVRQATENGAKRAAELLRKEAARPDENGVKGQSGISRKTSVEHLTGRGIRDILRRVENGAKVKF